MPWFKVDDKLAIHPKAVTAGNKALGLWVRSGSWSMAHLTDGHIPASMISVLGGTKSDAKQLVLAGLWVTVDDGWKFRDWADYQPTKETLIAEREATAKRVQKYRRNGVTSPVTNGVTTSVSNGVTTPAPVPYPVPYPNDSDINYLVKSGHLLNADQETTDSDQAIFAIQEAKRFGITDLKTVRHWFETTLDQQLDLGMTLSIAEHILSKARGEVRNVDGYLRQVATRDNIALLTAIKDVKQITALTKTIGETA